MKETSKILWVQRGSDIDGEAAKDPSGCSLETEKLWLSGHLTAIVKVDTVDTSGCIKLKR